MKTIFFFSIALCAVLCDCTVVFKCHSRNEKVEGVTISACEKPVCMLKKKSIVKIEQEFVPDHDVKKVVNEVKGIINSVPMPFIGVDGTDACLQMYKKGGNEKAECPLKKGGEYVYKNEFKIEPYYPNIALTIHYALKDAESKELVTCFEIPAKISN